MKQLIIAWREVPVIERLIANCCSKQLYENVSVETQFPGRILVIGQRFRTTAPPGLIQPAPIQNLLTASLEEGFLVYLSS